MSALPRTGFLLGMVLIGTAFRRHLDLGDVIGAGLFWTLLAIGSTLLALANGRKNQGSEAEDAAADARWRPWLVGIGMLWMLAVPTEPAIAVVSLAGAVLVLERLGRRRMAQAVQFAVLALLATTLVHMLVDRLAMMRYVATFVSDVVANVLQFLGVTAGSGADQLVTSGPESDPGFRATSLTLGLALHASIAAVLLLSHMLSGAGWRTRSAWAPVGYALFAVPLRLTMLVGVAVAMQHGIGHKDLSWDMSVFLDWRFGLGIDLFVAMVAGFFVVRPGAAAASSEDAQPDALPTSWRPRLAWAAIAVGVLSSSDRILDCVGSQKQGRIAIEEGHSRWESSDVHLTRDHYGQESGYNFRGIADWLELGYGPIRRIYDPIDQSSLDDVDVLVVKTPTTMFTPEELERIHAYVENGGGLVLIGDHTNVYGTSEVLNQIAQPYGFRFVYDCCFDHRNRYEFCYRKETEVQNHPITRDLDTMLFQVGCTIDIDSPRVRPIMVGRSLKSQMIDYSAQNFYGPPRDSSEQHKGQFAELVTCSAGSGRVVAIADSTLFSTFSVFMPGRREVVEGMVGFANHVDVGATTRDLLQRLAIGLALILLALAVPKMNASLLLTCGMLAWGAGSMSVTFAETWLYPGNPQITSPNEVDFIWEDGTVDWGVYGFADDHGSNYDLFFQFATRSERFPRLERDLDRATSTPNPIVWIDPNPEDLAHAEQKLVDFVASGGDLMLIETEPNQLVGAVAKQVGVDLMPARSVMPADGKLKSRFGDIGIPIGTEPFRTIRGGRALLTQSVSGSEKDVDSVAVVQSHGKGNVAILSCGALFANPVYGARYGTIPSEQLRRLYELQYAMFGAMADRSAAVDR